MIRINIIALTVFSVMSLSAMEGDNSQEQSPASYWPLSTSTDFTTSMIGLYDGLTNSLSNVSGLTSTTLNSVSGLAATAYRASSTRTYFQTMYGIGLDKEQAKIEQVRSRAAANAINQRWNNLFPLSEEKNLTLSEEEQYISTLKSTDNVDNMLSKRLAYLPQVIEYILNKSNTDITVLEDITAVNNTLGSWLPEAGRKALEHKEICVKKELRTYVEQPLISQSVIIKGKK